MTAEPEKSAQARRSAWAMALGGGSEFVGYTLAGFFAGQWLDGKLGSAPWLTLIVSMTGIILGLYRFVRAFIRPQNGPSGRG
ncbi:MAG: AtpZ/AtpI family protein [Elusimicrobia bacterium]|nr:AtpZ/AtpI family protein [Elusimicrobiota bacterium]